MKKGFVLIIVMMILFLLGVEFAVLNSTSNIIAIETNNALLLGDRENLISSGMALAEQNKFKTGDVIEPETGKLTSRVAKMSIKVENPGKIKVSTFCRTGSSELQGSTKISISK